jgi:hypothetical protein
MNRKETKLKGLSESRLGSLIFLLRMAGIPFKMKKVSTIYAIYMRTVFICVSTTYLGVCVDMYVHSEDLGRAMTIMRVLFSFTNIMWVFLYCR